MPGRFLACPSSCREAALAASHEYHTARRARSLGASFTEAGPVPGGAPPQQGVGHED